MAGNAVVRITGPMDVPDDVPAQIASNLRAVSITLRILKAAKMHALADLDGKLPDSVACSQEHIDLVNTSPFAQLVRVKTPEHPENVTIGICDTCGRWAFSATGLSAPSMIKGTIVRRERKPGKCKLSLECPGRYFVAHEAFVPSKTADADEASEPDEADEDES